MNSLWRSLLDDGVEDVGVGDDVEEVVLDLYVEEAVVADHVDEDEVACLVALDEEFAVQVDLELAVSFETRGIDADVHKPGELFHQQIAPVHKVVGVAARSFDLCDGDVQRGDLVDERVALLHHQLDFPVHGDAVFVVVLDELIEVDCEIFRLFDDLLADCGAVGALVQLLEACPVFVQGGFQPFAARFVDVDFQRCERTVDLFPVSFDGRFLAELDVEKRVAEACDGVDLDAGADLSGDGGAVEGRNSERVGGGGLDTLPGVAFDVGVRYVVSGGLHSPAEVVEGAAAHFKPEKAVQHGDGCLLIL